MDIDAPDLKNCSLSKAANGLKMGKQGLVLKAQVDHLMPDGSTHAQNIDLKSMAEHTVDDWTPWCYSYTIILTHV